MRLPAALSVAAGALRLAGAVELGPRHRWEGSLSGEDSLADSWERQARKWQSEHEARQLPSATSIGAGWDREVDEKAGEDEGWEDAEEDSEEPGVEASGGAEPSDREADEGGPVAGVKEPPSAERGGEASGVEGSSDEDAGGWEDTEEAEDGEATSGGPGQHPADAGADVDVDPEFQALLDQEPGGTASGVKGPSNMEAGEGGPEAAGRGTPRKDPVEDAGGWEDGEEEDGEDKLDDGAPDSEASTTGQGQPPEEQSTRMPAPEVITSSAKPPSKSSVDKLDDAAPDREVITTEQSTKMPAYEASTTRASQPSTAPAQPQNGGVYSLPGYVRRAVGRSRYVRVRPPTGDSAGAAPAWRPEFQPPSPTTSGPPRPNFYVLVKPTRKPDW